MVRQLTTPSLHPPKSMYARVNKASLLADEKKLIHPSHPHAIYRADLVLLGQPAGEAESTARGPSQVEHEKSRTGEVLWPLGSERCRFFQFC